MSGEKIPDDVRKLAVQMICEIPEGTHIASVTFLTRLVARAIMAERAAERERCAKIIEAKCEFILSRQNGEDNTVDTNLRMIACILPGHGHAESFHAEGAGMTLSRITYRDRSVVVVRFQQFGDGERCGTAHRPLSQGPSTFMAGLVGSVFAVARKLCENASSSFTDRFQLSLSASARGLVALSDGHRVGERKQPCPYQDSANPHRNRA